MFAPATLAEQASPALMNRFHAPCGNPTRRKTGLRMNGRFGDAGKTLFEEETDRRRGKGVFKKILTACENLRQAGVPFGISITSTAQNADRLLTDEVHAEDENAEAVLKSPEYRQMLDDYDKELTHLTQKVWDEEYAQRAQSTVSSRIHSVPEIAAVPSFSTESRRATVRR